MPQVMNGSPGTRANHGDHDEGAAVAAAPRAEEGTTKEQDLSRAEMSADRGISFRKSPAKQRSAPLATFRHQPRVLGDLALHEAAELHVPCCRSQIVTRCSSSPRARIG